MRSDDGIDMVWNGASVAVYHASPLLVKEQHAHCVICICCFRFFRPTAAGCLYTPDGSGHVDINDTDTSIAAYAFEDCTSLVYCIN